MISKFIIRKSAWYEPDYMAGVSTDPAWDYFNQIKSWAFINPLSRNYIADTALVATPTFMTNWPVTNITTSPNISMEGRLDSVQSVSGTNMSGITCETSGTFNSVVLQWNKFINMVSYNEPSVNQSALFAGVSKIKVALRRKSNNEVSYAFVFYPFTTVTPGLELQGSTYFLRTNHWNQKEGIILIEKELMALYNKKRAPLAPDPWGDAADITTDHYIDVWFEGNTPFYISNITAAKTHDIDLDEDLTFSSENLSNISFSKDYGSSSVKKGGKIKSLKGKLDLLTKEQFINYYNKIVKYHQDDALYFFPNCAVNEGNNSLDYTTNDEFKFINLEMGGLFFLDSAEYSNKEFNVYGAVVKLTECK